MALFGSVKTDSNSPWDLYRLLHEDTTRLAADQVAATLMFSHPTAIASAAGRAAGSWLPVFYWDDADIAAGTGYTVKMRTRAQLQLNNVAPGTITLTVGLYPITNGATTADTLTTTLGTVVASSTVAFTNPAAQNGAAPAQGVSSDYTVPADGSYALGVVTSATLANNLAAEISAQIQGRPGT